MLKRVPYNDNLIPIGNSPVYNGKPVYTDGQVAYGWQYMPRRPVLPKVKKRGVEGYFIGNIYTNYNCYELALPDLTLSASIPSNLPLGFYAYPCVATPMSNTMYTPTGNYHFLGELISMDSQGRCLTYVDELKLYQYDGQGNITHITDLSPLGIPSWGGDLTLYLFDYWDHNNMGSIIDYYGIDWWDAQQFFQLATPDGAYITMTEDYQQGPWHTYYVGNGRIVQRNYPNNWQVGVNATLNLNNFDLTIDGNTYSGDPLGVGTPVPNYGGNIFTWPSGIHVLNNYAISQNKETIYKFDNGQVSSKQYLDRIEWCFSLVYLKQPWYPL